MHLQSFDWDIMALLFAVWMTRWGANVPISEVNPWRLVPAGGIMVQIIPVKVHHALDFSTKRKWSAKNKFNFTAPLSSRRKEPCDSRRLLVSWQSGPFWSPGYLCSSDVCVVQIDSYLDHKQKKKKLKGYSTSALLWFSVGFNNRRATAASPVCHEVWIHWNFEPGHNRAVVPAAFKCI